MVDEVFAALLWKNNFIMRNEWWVETYGNIAFAAFGAADGLVFFRYTSNSDI